MRFAIVGVGAVGTRIARQLVSSDDVEAVILRDERTAHVEAVVASLGECARLDSAAYDAPVEADVVILAGPAGVHASAAATFVARGQSVVSVSDEVGDVRGLLRLEDDAQKKGVAVVVGAGFAPGFTCVLARHAASRFDEIDEVHIAKAGTGGPSCARQHHKALGGGAIDWRDGDWLKRTGGSGRELCWFPDPIGGRDCYRAALPDALLLVPAIPNVRRVTSRVASTRRDRLTARFPMLWPTHPEGGVGAIRVEVRGRRGSAREVVAYGAMDRPAVAAGAVAAVASLAVARAQLERVGAGGLASLVEPVPFLTELRSRGVRAALFVGEQAQIELHQ